MQGPTLVVVRSTTGHTFGGYANASWNGHAPTNVGGCFLFLVENPHNDPPTCFECKPLAKQAMLCGAHYGPTFGSGFDIGVHDDSDTTTSYTNFPHSYIDTLGRGHATFTGARDFTPEDYEVWGEN
jgi:hypothetical protein